MAISCQAYIESVKEHLSRAFCLYDVPGVHPEHPEVEFPSSAELKLNPITVRRGPAECCFIEPSINSARVSLKIKQTDGLEKWLTKRWIAFLTQAPYAEAFGILRRVPVEGYDLSFIITVQHCLEYSKDSLIEFICHFIKHSLSATEMKLLVSSRGRAVALDFLSNLTK